MKTESIINKFKIADAAVDEIKKRKKERGAFKIFTNHGEFCLKESKYNETIISFIMDILEKLEKSNFKNIPEYVTSFEEKKYYIEEKKIYTISRWIESERIDFTDRQRVIKFIDTLHNFHKLSKGIKNIPEERRYYGRWITMMEKKIREMYLFQEVIESKNEKEITEFDILFLKNMKTMIKDSIKSIEELYNTEYYKKSKKAKDECQICHHDLEYHNILIDKNEKFILIDFDYVIGDIIHHDIASLINRVERKNFYKCNNNYDYIFEKYGFDIDDKQIIAGLIMFAEEFWQVGYQYYVEKQKWNESKFLRKICRVIENRDGKMKLIEIIKN